MTTASPVAQQIAISHFGKRIVRALAKQGIVVIGLQSVPAFPGDNFFTETAYVVSNDECGEVWTYAQVIAAAGRETTLTAIEQRLARLT